MTKLKIDLKNGYLEVEGEEAFVNGIYADYKDVLSHVISRQPEMKPASEILTATKAPEVVISKKSTSSTPVQSRGKSMESYKILGDLNLAPDGKTPLRKFMAEKDPEGAGEINAVVVYYLQKILKIESITLEHVYTCYKHTEKRAPSALRQSLKDVKRRKGWIDCTDFSKIHMTTSGENFVEHDLPRPTSSDKK